MHTAIYALADESRGWVIEHIDPDDDGLCEKAIFYGPSAERQARDYAMREYGTEAISPKS